MNNDWFSKILNDMESEIYVKMMKDYFEVDLHSETMSQREYKRLEHPSYIDTKITDSDMLKVHIDIALSSGDRELFMELTDQLQSIRG